MKKILLVVLSFLLFHQVDAQYIDGNNVKYGNEWIDHSKEYFKLSLNQDGIYRISKGDLEAAGFPVSSAPMNSFSLFHLGKEVHIHTSGNGIMTNSDYIEFHGQKNRNEIDKFTFDDKNDQLNPEFSLITDMTAYFLSYNTGSNLRYNASATQLSNNLPPLETHYMHTEMEVYSNKFTKAFNGEVRYSSPTITEGFGTGLIKSKSVGFTTSNIYDNGPEPSLRVRFGTNTVQHIIKLSVANNLVDQFSFSGYRVTENESNFSKAYLTNSFTAKIEGTHSNNDKMSLAFLELKYARAFIFDGANTANFNFDANSFDRYIELQEFDLTGGKPVFYDLGTKRRLEAAVEGGLVKMQSPGSLVANEFIVINDNSVQTPSSIEQMNFIDFGSMNHDYLIISHNELFSDPNNGKNYVQEYADYRSSAAGGEYNSIVVDVEDIYNQFGYGIERHHLGLRSFLNWSKNNWSELEYVFIIGKGREYGSYRSDAQQAADPTYFVPTYGFPGSDNLLMSSFGKTSPQVPLGRIATRNTDDIRIYLQKVMEHESLINEPQTIENKLWMKRVLHMSGGDPTIQEFIKSSLSNMESILENNSYGAEVTTIYKSSSDPIENSQSDIVKDLINSGVSILTFFGHSAVGVFDLNLEDVTAYDNKGKYPLLLSLGCHSGNVHSATKGLSEQFVLTEDKGSIAFVASASQAFISPQGTIGRNVYDELGNSLNSKSVGDVMRNVANIFESNTSSSWETLMEQLTLHGDPAARMHSNEGEDYTPDFSSINTSPEVINAFQSEFEVCFDVANLGLAIDTTFSLNVKHFGPNGDENVDTSFTVNTPSYLSNYCVTLPINSNNLVGKNTLTIYVDDSETREEMPNPGGEMNNELNNGMGGKTYDFFILNNGAVPVSPKAYSIVNEEEVVLRASSFNALGDRESFIFQLDTLGTFNSPFMQEFTVTDAIGLLQWEPDIDFVPGTVYYWRVSPVINTSGPGQIWNKSSFIYLPSSDDGWSQSHYDQYKDNEFDQLELENNKLDYISDLLDIRIINKVRVGEDFPLFLIGGGFFGTAYPFTVGPQIGVFSVDSLLNIDWNEPGGKYGVTNPTGASTITHFFDPTSQDERIKLVNYLEDIVPSGNNVFFYTILPQNNFAPDFKTQEWITDGELNNGKTIFSVLESQGATMISDFKTDSIVPYNFFYKKDREALQESKAADMNGVADNSTPISGKWFTGTETSTKIGPSTKWRKLVWKDELSDNPTEDSSYIRIFGVTVDGRDTLLRDQIFEKEVNLAQIDATVFPYLKLQYYTFDNIKKSTPDLLFWRVFYDGIPELALDILDDEAIFQSDTIDQGEDFVLKIPLKNIGEVDVDSIEVKITMSDQNNENTIIIQTLSPIAAGEKDFIEYSVPTVSLDGIYTVTIEANLRRTPEECFYFNNFGLRKFLIRNDQRNPILDVSFDGRRIMNGDIVSATPTINIITKDENQYLLLNDTTTYTIDLIDPNGILTKVFLNDPNVLFTPAVDANNNQSEILFTPTLEIDGFYRLNVSSSDRSGNTSGNEDFSIEFQVINEELVSNVFNYPNPFSECTQFVFTLTGNEMPQDIDIRIMTVSGKVVREISGLELGPLHIGVNRTEFKWDGTDEFGSKLANGVYLYQVTTKKESGELYEKYDTNTDQYFKKSIGKLVIMR